MPESLTAWEREILYSVVPIENYADLAPIGLAEDWQEDVYYNMRTSVGGRRSHSHNVQCLQEYFSQWLGLSNCIITPTATLAFSIVCSSLMRPGCGDEIVCLLPGFDVYPKLIDSFGGRTTFVERNRDFGFSVDAIRTAINDRTRAVVLCVPDNPTGHVPDRETLLRVARLCVERRLVLILDYCFAHYFASGQDMPILSNEFNAMGLRHVAIADTGKTYGLHGTKIGAILSSSELSTALQVAADCFFISVSRFDAAVFSSILPADAGPAYLERNRMTVNANRQILRTQLNALYSVRETQGGSFAVLDVTSICDDDGDFVRYLVREHGIALVPFRVFASGRRNAGAPRLLRMALARPERDIRRAVETLNEAAQQYMRKRSGALEVGGT